MGVEDTAKPGSGRERSPESRANAVRPKVGLDYEESPAAGAHAARHLMNDDATPGAGVLPGHSHRAGKEVDGGAG